MTDKAYLPNEYFAVFLKNGLPAFYRLELIKICGKYASADGEIFSPHRSPQGIYLTFDGERVPTRSDSFGWFGDFNLGGDRAELRDHEGPLGDPKQLYTDKGDALRAFVAWCEQAKGKIDGMIAKVSPLIEEEHSDDNDA